MHTDPRAWALHQLGVSPPARSALAPVALGENASTSGLTVNELASALGALSPVASGEQVTADTALRVSTVYRCVDLVAGSIASLPLHVYERSGQDSRRVDSDVWWLFNERASDGWTSHAAWVYLFAARMLHGDGFAELLRPSAYSSRVIGWQPWHPSRVEPFVSGGALYYRLSPAAGPVRVVDAADMLHIPSLGFDGLRSPSPITYAARESIGTALAADKYAGRFFSGGATFDYALTSDRDLKSNQITELTAALRARVATNGRAPLLLTGGLKPAQLSINSRDAEILATRQFGVDEICRAFGVPPQLVGAGDKSAGWAGSSLEQMSGGFVRFTLLPQLVAVAQEINSKLWPTRARYYVQHDTAALERGDLSARTAAYRTALGRAGEPGWMTVNEIRRAENLPPAPGGDVLMSATPAAPQDQPDDTDTTEDDDAQ